MRAIAEVWFEEGLEKGLERGREEGREEGRQSVLHAIDRLLTLRFGAIPQHVHNLLDTYELDVLNIALDLAAEAEDLHAFTAALPTLDD